MDKVYNNTKLVTMPSNESLLDCIDQIDQTEIDAATIIVNELNKKHAVTMVGGSCLILNDIHDPVLNRPDITLSSPQDFFHCYANMTMPVEDGNGKSREMSIGKLWYKSRLRRQYDGIVFSPNKDVWGFFNLWRGFSVEAKQGDWSLFREHIRRIIANDVETYFNYILAWMAHIVQQPGGKRPGTALVLRGKQGTGKGCFATIFGQLFGSHFLHISNAQHFVGRFNAHLKDVILLFVDEGFWAGDKAAESILKTMITEDTELVEPKGKDAFAVKNHKRLIIASNSDWIIPAADRERRFFVLDVNDTHIQNKDYFTTIFEQMHNGGLEAMFYDLLHMDISTINLSSMPRTEAMFDQALYTMEPVKKFWFECLRLKRLSEDDHCWSEKSSSKALYQAYCDFSKNLGRKNLLSSSQFGKKLRELCPDIWRSTTFIGNGRREYTLMFPSLTQCRLLFEKHMGTDINWAAYEAFDFTD